MESTKLQLSEYEQHRANKITFNNARLRKLGLITEVKEKELNDLVWGRHLNIQHKCPSSKRRVPRHEIQGNIVAEYNYLNHKMELSKETYWEVEAIVGYRQICNSDQFLIRWKGCSKIHDSWEPKSNLDGNARKWTTNILSVIVSYFIWEKIT